MLFFAYLNAAYETGFANLIDEAIRTYRQFDLSGFKKLDEVPYDFIRKRLSILVSRDGTNLLVIKGALQNVLDVCSSAEAADGKIVDMAVVREEIDRQFDELSHQGFRTLGVAYRNLASGLPIGKEQETGMTFLGFIALFDPPKPGIMETMQRSSRIRRSGSFLPSGSRAMWWVISATGSTMPRRCIPPMWASPWTAPWMSPRGPRRSCCLKRIWASSCRASGREDDLR